MSTDEMQELWKTYDVKLQQSMNLNRRLIEEIGSIKVKSAFNRLIASRVFKIVWGVIWNGVCGWLLWRFRSEPVFVLSAAFVMVINSIGIAGYTYQLVIITQIDFESPILEMQQKLAQLEESILCTHRIMVLQTPVYTVFYLNSAMIHGMGFWGWFWQGLITGLFVLMTMGAYRAITMKNADKGWMKAMMRNEGWRTIARAREFIREIEEYRQE